ncbi:hypothetical protein [Streptomyces sp. NPDC048521]|uniref:hypothetical protein n=1 Tax=Streptomyces sp. NPDC048521 TaxID=3365566 RepID=UPI0037246240
MTSSLIRGRPRHAKAQIRARVAHVVLGALIGGGWLVLPVMTVAARDPVPVPPSGPVAGATAPQQDETSTADLVLPLVAGGAAVVLAGYGYLRRTRRARSRTTPGIVSVHPPTPAPAESERQARAALVLADDCVRTSREELSFVRQRFGEAEVEPFTHALRAAETELSAAFAIWRRYEQGVPAEADARRQALVGVIGRCAEAGRRLDAEAPALDRLRGLEEGVGGALEVAEGRFRELTVRTAAAQGTLTALHERYPPLAAGSVTGYVEQAKDRLVFATAQLNRARQADDSGEEEWAAGHLRAAEGAIAQAGVLTGAVERLAAQLRQAADLLPPTLTDAEAKLTVARKGEVALKGEMARRQEAAREGRVIREGEVARDDGAAREEVLREVGVAREEAESMRQGEGTREGKATRGDGATRTDDATGSEDEATREGRATREGATREDEANRDEGLARDEGRAARDEDEARHEGQESEAVGKANASPESWAARAGAVRPSMAVGELHARLVHADGVLAAVRAELTGGPYDPLDALRRITRAVARLRVGRSGVLDTAALLVARSSVAGAEEFVAVHRGAVGAEARARLAEAVRSLTAGDAERADTESRHARELAERDVRTHGNPYAGPDGDSAGLVGAVLGGILLAEDPTGGPPAGFGGPETRSRHRFPPTP